MKRKIASIVLTVIMILSLAPCALAASSGEVETRMGAVTWSISGNTLTINGTGEIPDDFSIDELDNSARQNVTKLVVGNGITSIGSGAFEFLSDLETAELAASVEAIGDDAFMNLKYLYKVTMPGVVTIGDSAFYRTLLDEDYAPLPETLAVIGKSAFAETKYSEFTLPASVSTIGENALGSEQLSRITVAEENPMFSAENGILFDKEKTALICYPAKCRLKEWDRETTPQYEPDTYTIPSTVKRICGYALNDAIYLGKVIMPASVEEIGKYAFNPAVLTEIDTTANGNYTYENGVLYDNPKTMVYTGLVNSVPEKLVIADGVKYIERFAFSSCAITELVLPESLETIGRNAFADCESLAKMTMYKGVKGIEYGAFSWDDAIATVQFNGTKGDWNRLEETAENGNATLFNAEVTFSDPDGVSEPMLISFGYLPAAEVWHLEFYAGTVTDNCKALIALYDKTKNALLGVREKTLTSESVIEFVDFDEVPEDASVKAVVYCWNSSGGMEPVWNTPLVSE